MKHNLEPQTFNGKLMGRDSEEMSPKSLGTLSSVELWEDSSALTGSDLKGDLFRNGFANMVQQLNESHSHVVSLEKEVNSLKEEKLKQEYQNHVCVTRLKDQIKKLEQKAEIDIEELKRRQNQIETEVPSLEEQIKSLKDVLHDLNISETLYFEIISIPKESRTIREHILVLAYERMQKYRHDVEDLRQERDISREALSRANDEVQKLRRDMQRSAAIDAVERQSKDRETEAVLARNERLETELRNSSLQVQILSAKGALYDEVKCNIVKLEEMLVSKEEEKIELSKTFQNLDKELKQCEESVKDREHCIELLQMEKAYLSGQFKAQEDQLKKVEAEKSSHQEKVQELEEAQRAFYNRVLCNDDTAHAALDQRLHEEKLQMQGRNKQELDLLRAQIAEAANFEIQMLRKTRDLAVAECEKLQVALLESRTDNEKLMKKYHELQSASMRSSNAEEDGILKRESELHKIQEQTYRVLCQTKIENEVLKKKVECLTENLLTLESDMGKEIIGLKLKLESANASLKQYQSEEQVLNETLLNAVKVLADPVGEAILCEQSETTSSMHGRLDMIFMVVKRCKVLQDNMKVLENEKERLQHKITEAHEKVDEMNQKISCMDQPTSSLASAIQKAEKKLKEALEQKEILEVNLREAVMEKDKANHSLQSLREDLKRLLQARGNIESLQKILMEKDCNLGNAVLEKLASLRHSPRGNQRP